jgi:hypothetical protein
MQYVNIDKIAHRARLSTLNIGASLILLLNGFAAASPLFLPGRAFATGGPSIPSVPAPTSPAAGATLTDGNVTLTWQASTGGSGTVFYTVEVATASTTNADGSFSSSTGGTTTTGLSYTPSGTLAVGTYYWNVKACNDNSGSHCSAWSTPENFTVTAPDTTGPAIGATTPVDNEVIAKNGNYTVSAAVSDPSGVQDVSYSATDGSFLCALFSSCETFSGTMTDPDHDGTYTATLDTSAHGVVPPSFFPLTTPYTFTFTAIDNSASHNVSNKDVTGVTFSPPVSTASVTGQDFGTWDNSVNGFKGINVGFKTADFTHINSIEVTLQKNGSDIVSNTASAALLDDINNQQDGFQQNGSLSTPFVVSGTLTDTYCQGGPCWNTSTHTWQPSEQPDTAIVTVVGTDADGSVTKVATLTNFTEPDGVSFADLFPPDTTPPGVPTGGLPNNSYEKTNDFYFTWNPVTDTSTPVSYEFQSSLNPASSGGVLTTDLWHSGTLTSPTIHSTGAPDGTWYWQVRAKDAAGNFSDWSAIWRVTIDTGAPTVHVTAPGTDQIIKGHAIVIKGTVNDPNFNYYYCYVTDAHGEVGTRDSLCETAWAAGTPFHSAFAQTATGTTDGTLGTITLPNGQADGTYTVHVVAKDKAGNSTEATQTFVLDNTRPSLAFTAPASFASYYKVAPTVTVQGSDANDLSVMVIHVYDAGTDKLVGSPACTATSAELASGNLSCDLAGLPDDSYFLKAGTNDTAGNNQTITSTTFTVDSTPPDVTINGYSPNSNVITPHVTASDATSLTYAWTANDAGSAANVVISDPTALEPTFTANADGTYNFTLTVTDQAGNATARTFGFSYAAPHTFAPAAAITGGQNTSGNTGGNFTGITTGAPGGTPQVLGDSTGTPDTGNGQVKGDQTTALNTNTGSNEKNAARAGAFLGLGWWWLLILAILLGLWYALLGRRSNEA